MNTKQGFFGTKLQNPYNTIVYKHHKHCYQTWFQFMLFSNFSNLRVIASCFLPLYTSINDRIALHIISLFSFLVDPLLSTSVLVLVVTSDKLSTFNHSSRTEAFYTRNREWRRQVKHPIFMLFRSARKRRNEQYFTSTKKQKIKH